VEVRGWELLEVFTDDDISAFSRTHRPAFEAMLELIATGTVDVLVAWHPDRITRHPRELEDVIDVLEAARCTVDTVRGGTVDLSTRSGRTTARLVGAVARDESEAKAERLRAMHADKARKGEWPGGPRPFGYRPKNGTLVIDNAEAGVISEAAQRVLAGETLHGICADLNARNVPTARGGKWRTPTLRRILTGCTVAGRREHKGDDVGPGNWLAILDTRTHHRVTAVLDGTGRARGRVARVSLLAGMARCGRCGTTLATQRRSTGVRVYVCPATSLGGCGGTSIVADQLDDLVAAAVLARSDSPALADALNADQPTDADDDLAEIEQALVDLATDLGERRITRREWLAARAPLEAARDAARVALARRTGSTALAPYSGRPGALSTAFETMTLDQRRAVVGAVVDRVEVAPATRRGPGFDAGRVSVTWAV
jgi:DNA invertase Pin-like site-specific DNA recombinase